MSWAPSQMPVDVRAVDLLQELLEERETRMPLVVIVSAWDLAAATTPAAWIAEQLPLLDQFLACNSEQLPHAVFGVSAQGVAFDEASTRHRSSPTPGIAPISCARTGCAAPSQSRSNG